MNTPRSFLLALGLAASIQAAPAAAQDVRVPAPDSPPSPILETWDGNAWRFEEAPCGAAVAPVFARRDIAPLVNARRTADGYLRLRLRGGGPFIAEVDEIGVLAVDHDSTVTVAPGGIAGFHTVDSDLLPPSRAVDREGHDVLALVARDDSASWDGTPRHRDPAIEEDLSDGFEMDFIRPAGATQARLIIDAAPTPWAAAMLRAAVDVHGFQTEAWYKAVVDDPVKTRLLRQSVGEDAWLHVAVGTLAGWEPRGDVAPTAPGAPRRTAIALDLSRVIGETVHVRVAETPGFWRIDRVALDLGADGAMLVQEVRPQAAETTRGLDLRGAMSAEDRVDGRVAPRDTVELAFYVPPLQPGKARSYFVRTTGWWRPAVPSTAEPNTAAAAALMAGPGSLARFAIERANSALRAYPLK